MKARQQTLDVITQKFTAYLKKNKRRPSTIENYTEVWKRLKVFMQSRRIQFYDRKVGERYLKYLYGSYTYSNLTKYRKNIVNYVEGIAEFRERGTILMGPRKMPERTFPGVIGTTMECYIGYKKEIHQICNSTLHNYRLYLHGLYIFLKGHSIHTISQISPNVILLFVNSSHNKTLVTRHSELLVIKGYLKYLYDQQMISSDFSEVIPKDNYKAQVHLPSTFSKEEVHLLLKSIDRSSPKGRRDYAAILLATKLGLRASDITGLKFEHIQWEKHIISFEQKKTRKNIKVPLLPEIGNAIIDYLKNGRPASAEKFCFLQIQSPYKPINKSSLGNMVTYYLNLAGINYKNRRHGPHALRHSLAGNLLGDRIPIPTISEVLGHSDSEITMDYLRIDTTSLKQCALDVPLVPTSFYNQ